MTSWLFIRWLHLIAMAFFVGGQLFLAAVVVPVQRKLPDQPRMQMIARRFGYATLIAIGVLILTGSALASHFHQWKNPDLHAKLGLVAVAGALIAMHMRWPKLRVLDGAIFLVSLAIVWLGIDLAH